MSTVELTYGPLRKGEEREVQRVWQTMSAFLGRPAFLAQLIPDMVDVARYNGRPVAFCYYRHGKVKPRSTIQAIAVLPMFRKHGVARALIGRLAASSPHDVIFLKVEADNPAVSFYRRLGFEVVEHEAARTGRAMLVMQAPTASLRPTTKASP